MSKYLAGILLSILKLPPVPYLLGWIRNAVGYALAAAMPGGVMSMVAPLESIAWTKFGIRGSNEAWRLQIGDAKPKGLRIASLWDFEVLKAEPLGISLAQLLRDKAGKLSPYSYEDQHGFVVLVEAKDDVDVTQGAGFYYQSQVANAAQLYAVPEEMFIAAVDAAVPAPYASKVLERTALLHSTGRCGSTLLSKILDTIGDSASFNEPDVFTCLTMSKYNHNPDGPGDTARLGRLARAATLLLVTGQLATLPAVKAEKTNVWIKFRSGVVDLARLMKMHMPETKNVYLYRNAIDYTDSACSGFMKMGPMPYMRMMGLDGFMVWKTSPLPRFSHPPREGSFKAYTKAVIQDVPENFRSVFDIGFVGQMGLFWQENIHHAWDCIKKGGIFDAVLRYEELVQHREAVVLEMLHLCGFAKAESQEVGMDASDSDTKASIEEMVRTDVDRVFSEDAHAANNILVSSRVDSKGNRIKAPVYIKEWEMDALVNMLRLHPEVGDPNIILPGTLFVSATEP